jgi:hypothetical protein
MRDRGTHEQLSSFIYFEGLYGMSYNSENGKIHIEGACGINSMIKIADAIGLEVEKQWDKKGNVKGFYVCERN